MENKWETNVKSCGPEHPEWERSAGDNEGDKCKIMRPRAPGVGDKCRRQVGDKCKIMRPRAPRVGDSVGDKCKIIRPRVPEHPEWKSSGRQV